MKKHRTLLLRFATNLSSREAGFVFALLGVIVQACHTWFLAYDLSSLPGIWRTIQAGLMAIFISAALLYFTLKSSDEDSQTARKYRRIVWWFACVETFINLYYWGDHLLIQPWPNPDYGSFIIAIPFSFLLPFVLKSYGSEVRTEDYSELDDEKEIPTEEILEPEKSQKKEPFHEEPQRQDIIPIRNLHEEDIDKMLAEEFQQEQQQKSEHEEILEPEIPSEDDMNSVADEVDKELEDTYQDPKVIDAKGNDALETEEPKVTRPQFSSTPKEQVVSIKNGTYTTTPAYVAEKK